MTNTAEAIRNKIVCEVVRKPEELDSMINLFHLAGAVTEQEVNLCITNDPGIAAGAVLSEELDAFVPDSLEALNTLKEGLRKSNDRMLRIGLAELGVILYEDPYHKAGVALISVIQGATAIFVNVADPAAFRFELDVFKDLASPQES